MDILQIIFFIIVGFVAQIIDGALGMAYGVTSNAFLLSLGVEPKKASAGVHSAEVFTTFVSGISHMKFGNVDKELFKKLVIPGVIGGIIGAYILTSVESKVMKPFVSIYLIVMGLIIISRAFRKAKELVVKTKIAILGAIGGFFDAIGGGGWGPIVTSTLIARGNNPKLTIGSVNAAEFFVTVAETASFFALLGLAELHQLFGIIVGLIIGGTIAAPIAAFACKKLPTRALLIIVGLLVILLNVKNLFGW